MPVKLYEHQKEDLVEMRKHDAFALFHEVGAGKSYPCIVRVLEWLSEHSGIVLIFTEVSLLGQLKQDFMNVLGEDGEVEVATLSGKTSSLDKQLLKKNLPDVLIINYEYAKQAVELIGDTRINGVWCDEGHRIKGFRGLRSKQGKRAKVIIDVSRRSPRRLLTTGSPVVSPDSPDIWALYYFLDPRIFGPTLWKFEDQYFYNVSNTRNYKVLKSKPHMRAEMSKNMYQVARRLLKSDLNIPFPERADPIQYDAYMSPKLERAYRELEKDSLALVEGTVVTRPMLLARLMSLQQLSSGFLIERDAIDPLGLQRDESTRRVMHVDSSHKDKILVNILENIGKQASCIIWAVFTHEIEHLMKLVADVRGHVPSRADGHCKGSERERGLEAFKSGRNPTLIAHPAAAGAGLNLQIAGHAIRYSRTYKLIDWEQSRGRNHRAGKMIHEAIFDHEIVTPDTSDDKIYQAVLHKLDLAHTITLDFLTKEERNR